MTIKCRSQETVGHTGRIEYVCQLYLKSSAGIKFPLLSSALPFPFQADTHGLTFFEYSYVGSVNQLNLTSLRQPIEMRASLSDF
jgi:hypothetical protein